MKRFLLFLAASLVAIATASLDLLSCSGGGGGGGGTPTGAIYPRFVYTVLFGTLPKSLSCALAE